jgi:ABC-type Na+ efflux pump permease subunit
MSTFYDWLTLALFAGLIVLFLQRSSMDNPPDKLIQYLPPALGCALANQVGNHAVEGGGLVYHGLSVLILAASIGYVMAVLKPTLKG